MLTERLLVAMIPLGHRDKENVIKTLFLGSGQTQCIPQSEAKEAEKLHLKCGFQSWRLSSTEALSSIPLPSKINKIKASRKKPKNHSFLLLDLQTQCQEEPAFMMSLTTLSTRQTKLHYSAEFIYFHSCLGCFSWVTCSWHTCLYFPFFLSLFLCLLWLQSKLFWI